jgi:hypothetical protein
MVILNAFPGFDPFHETQKGLADLLESESKAAEAQQHQQVSTIIISVADPGCLSRIPDPDFYPSRMPVPDPQHL